MTYRLKDAQATHREHPETFWAPTFHELDQISAGWLVKLCAEWDADDDTGNVASLAQQRAIRDRGWAMGAANGERFWVIVTKLTYDRNGVTYSGVVNNDLIYTDHHGLVLNSPISFERRHILTYEDPDHLECLGNR